MPLGDFEPVEIYNLPLEDMREVIEAMAAAMKLRLEKRTPFHGEPEYRFVPNS